MKSSILHHINTGLILLSCLIAFFIPFELFLFSYGILGPLHYLTEISWLHKKNYFTKGKFDFIFLIVACVILVYWNFNPPSDKNYNWIADLILLSFLASIGFVFIKEWIYRLLLFVGILIFISMANNSFHYFTWVAIFLPTIIHVFIFTWLFMIYGVVKEKSWAGLISILTLIACAILLFALQPLGLNYEVSHYVEKSYSLFGELNLQIINTFHLDQLTDIKQVFRTNGGFLTMRFIAFAYTYHYLNWFSKTSVIKWHLVPKKTLIVTLIIWLFSISLYIYSYDLGLKMLFFLSFLHVFLEFPLNVVSFTGIGKGLFSFIKK